MNVACMILFIVAWIAIDSMCRRIADRLDGYDD